MEDQQPVLARKIGLPLILFYGLGTILGAGIYVLVGKVAGAAGLYSPLAFLAAALIAGVTALSYAQLVQAFPKAAGEAVFIFEGFQLKSLSGLVGWLVVVTGIVSSATIVIGFVGYLSVFFSVPREIAILLLVFALACIAAWGVAESLWIAAAMTLIEIFGLLLVLTLTADTWLFESRELSQYFVPQQMVDFSYIFAGAFIAFYAFIGFEDMVNVVEEVKEPERNMPLAIYMAIALSTLLYMVVAFASVSVLSVEALQASEAPMADLLAGRYPLAEKVIAVISLFAVLNGALIQMIMGSRVLYGMARANMAPKIFAQVNERSQTPVLATMVLAGLILFFALVLPLLSLAKLTSFVVLTIFLMVNLSLWRLQGQSDWLAKLPEGKAGPAWPLFGALLCILLLGFQLFSLVFDW